jgi:predicted metal-dependent peptidase
MNQIDKTLEQACRIFPYLPYVLRRVSLTSKAGEKSFMRWTKDGTVSINIDPTQANTPETFEFVLLHEVGHIIYAAYLFADDPRSKESRTLVNIAMDLIINETIIDFDKKYKDSNTQLGGWSFDVVKQHFNLDLNLEMTWMEIYDALRPHAQFVGVASLVDEHQEGDEGDEGQSPSKEIIDSILKDRNISSSIKGLDLKDLSYKETKKLKHEKFKMELSKYMGTLISYDKKPSIMRPNRRSSDAIKGFKKDKKVNALVAVDTSGSIASYIEELNKSFAVILNYCDSVDILPFHGEAEAIIKNVTRLPVFTPGGGTNFHALEPYPNKYDVMIVVSDLECDPPTFKEDNVIYISNNSPAWVKDKKHVLL